MQGLWRDSVAWEAWGCTVPKHIRSLSSEIDLKREGNIKNINS